MSHQGADIVDPTLYLPRILCLHGGGTNSRIFKAQCRVLIHQLKPYFRLCFAEAPFPSSAGPDVTSIYKAYLPFRRWLRWQPDHPAIENEAAIWEIDSCLDAAKLADDMEGATGEWVGLMGFSQGAKVCASILLRQQMRAQGGAGKCGPRQADGSYGFGILLAGRGPLVSLDLNIPSDGLVGAADLGLPGESIAVSGEAPRLRLPIIHMHGLRDPGIELHRKLITDSCDNASVRLVEWDGDHRVPVKTRDVEALVMQILDVAKTIGLMIDT
ncbi:serine hydrolase FSH [Hypoxylon argillaceum]|nr:serine hydrolase FSH [Hypoxylon argillaceum]